MAEMERIKYIKSRHIFIISMFIECDVDIVGCLEKAIDERKTKKNNQTNLINIYVNAVYNAIDRIVNIDQIHFVSLHLAFNCFFLYSFVGCEK